MIPSDIDFKNVGVLLFQVEQTILDALWLEVNKIQSDFTKAAQHNKSLAGNIVHEYTLTESRDTTEKYLFNCVAQYEERFHCLNMIGVNSILGRKQEKDLLSLSLGGLWVNFQKKGEFNPMHTHNGIWSFVIWLQIPYFIELERKVSPGRRNDSTNRSGAFEFAYCNILGDICNHGIDADKKYEGHMLLFPSRLNHAVYPFFSSEDYRISVSGNIYIND